MVKIKHIVIILGIFILGVLFSGCIDSINNKKIDINTLTNNKTLPTITSKVEQTKQVIPETYDEKTISVNDDANKIIGKWRWSYRVPYSNEIDYFQYSFNKDGTGTFETSTETSLMFKYEIGDFPVFTESIIYDPVAGFPGYGKIYRDEDKCSSDSRPFKCIIHTSYIKLYNRVSEQTQIIDYKIIDDNHILFDFPLTIPLFGKGKIFEKQGDIKTW